MCARCSIEFQPPFSQPPLPFCEQGFANMASAAVGGLPATGAIARTAASVRCPRRFPFFLFRLEKW